MFTTGYMSHKLASSLLTRLGIPSNEIESALAESDYWNGRKVTRTHAWDSLGITVTYRGDLEEYPYKISSAHAVPNQVNRFNAGKRIVSQFPNVTADVITVIAIDEPANEIAVWVTYASDGFSSFHNGEYIPVTGSLPLHEAYKAAIANAAGRI